MDCKCVSETNYQCAFWGGDGKCDHPKATDGWISVEDRLPENDVIVLIWYARANWDNGYKPGVFMGNYIAKLDEFRPYGSSGDFRDDISHWMPLPAPPTGEEE